MKAEEGTAYGEKTYYIYLRSEDADGFINVCKSFKDKAEANNYWMINKKRYF